MDSLNGANPDLLSCQKQLSDTLKKLSKTERRLEKAQQYNQELVKELDELKQEVHVQRQRSKKINRVDQETQTEDILSNHTSHGFHPPTASTQHSVENTVTEPVYEPLDLEQTSADGNTQSIADQLRSAAEQAITQTGYVYDESSGLYYDQQTGYYYNPENKLYYDNSSCCYYTYNEQEGCYQFHSQADMSQYEEYYKHQALKEQRLANRAAKQAKRELREARKVNKEARKRCTHPDETSMKRVCQTDISAEEISDHVTQDGSTAEDCVISQSDAAEESSETEDGEVVSSDEELSALSDNSDAVPEVIWRPPCIRAIVEESDSLEVGGLHIVTITGGNIGRDSSCTICVPEDAVNETHCKLRYAEEERCYYVVELGSNHGTFLNSQRLAESGGSSSCRLSNRDKLVVGSTKLLLHIHPGTDTCTDCEPGVLESRIKSKQAQEHNQSTDKVNVEKQRRSQLKSLKKKYGLEKGRFVQKDVVVNPKYEDKAEKRRQKFGVELPNTPDTAPSSVDSAISNQNKGHKMLEKMGWKSGESLGKSQTGIIEPIKVDLRLNASAGLGSTANKTISMDDGGNLPRARKKAEIMLKTQRRFEKAKTANIFSSSIDDFEYDEQDQKPNK